MSSTKTPRKRVRVSKKGAYTTRCDDGGQPIPKPSRSHYIQEDYAVARVVLTEPNIQALVKLDEESFARDPREWMGFWGGWVPNEYRDDYSQLTFLKRREALNSLLDAGLDPREASPLHYRVWSVFFIRTPEIAEQHARPRPYRRTVTPDAAAE